MKMSEAIRLGAMLKPQGFGAESVRNPVASCALGAALDAVGVPLSARAFGDGYVQILDRWPVSARVHSTVEGFTGNLVDVAWQLNDEARWTRERIADWVEQIEAQHASQQAGKQNLTEALR